MLCRQEESLALAGISSASVLGRIALGRGAGARVWRLGHDPEAAWVASSGPRDRLRLTGDGRIRLTLKTPWAAGPRAAPNRPSMG